MVMMIMSFPIWSDEFDFKKAMSVLNALQSKSISDTKMGETLFLKKTHLRDTDITSLSSGGF